MRLMFLALASLSCMPATAPLVTQDAHAVIAMTIGVEQVVALTTSVQRISGVNAANWLEFFDECDPTYVYVIDDPTAVDGETALPSTGRARYPTSLFPGSVYISNASRIGLAASSNGNCRLRFRYVP